MATTQDRLAAIARWLTRDPDGAREAIVALTAVERDGEVAGAAWELLGRIAAITGADALARDAFAAAAADHLARGRALDAGAAAAIAAAMPIARFADADEALRRDAALLAAHAGAETPEPRLVAWRAVLELRHLVDAADPDPCRPSAAVARLGLDPGETALVRALGASRSDEPAPIAAWIARLAASVRAPIDPAIAARLIDDAILAPGDPVAPLVLDPALLDWLDGRRHRIDAPGFHVAAFDALAVDAAPPEVARAAIRGGVIVTPGGGVAVPGRRLVTAVPERSLAYADREAVDRAGAVLIREARLAGAVLALELDEWAGAPIDAEALARRVVGRGDPVILIDRAADQPRAR